MNYKAIILFVLFSCALPARAADIKIYPDFTVSWMPVTTTIDGGDYPSQLYRVSWGPTTGGPYPNSQLTGSDEFYKFTGWVVGRRACFVVRALAASAGDDDSDLSTELCVAVIAKPVVPPPPPPRKKLSTPQGLVISEGAAPP